MPYRLPVIFGFAAMALAGCGEAALPENPPTLVSTQVVALVSYAPTISLTGEIKARVQNDLSFRVSGRIIARQSMSAIMSRPIRCWRGSIRRSRMAEYGGRRSQPARRRSPASAGVVELRAAAGAARAGLHDPPRTSTRPHEAFRTAQGSVDSARAQLALARDQLSYTVLRAGVPGVITARNIEAGQVVQAAQTAFTLAQDGPRDAVFNVHESVFRARPRRQGPMTRARRRSQRQGRSARCARSRRRSTQRPAPSGSRSASTRRRPR